MSEEVKKTNNKSETDGNTEVEEFDFDGDFSIDTDTADTELVDDDTELLSSKMDLEAFAGCFSENFEAWPPVDMKVEPLSCFIKIKKAK